MVRLAAYEVEGVSEATRLRVGVGAEFTIQGKILWARIDESDDSVWVRFDHIVATGKGVTPVKAVPVTQWVEMGEFLANFVRAVLPYRYGGFWYNKECWVKNEDNWVDREGLAYHTGDEYDQDGVLDDQHLDISLSEARRACIGRRSLRRRVERAVRGGCCLDLNNWA